MNYTLTRIQYRWNQPQPFKMGIKEEKELEIEDWNQWDDKENEENETQNDNELFAWID